MPGPTSYPKPKETGGKLIRSVIQFMRSQGVQLPFNSHILIATSGGADSVALAHLLARYGRRVVDPSQIVLVHINHGWRGKESTSDEKFVAALAKKLGVRCQIKRLPPGAVPAGESWEAHARTARKKIYRELSEEWAKEGAKEFAQRSGAPILTAHHADDVAETMLWRIFTGTTETHGGGILFKNDQEIRPFLKVRKALLKRYLKEERQEWREDRTNHEGRFLRSKMRQVLLPEIESLFPRAIENLVSLGLRAQAAYVARPAALAADGEDVEASAPRPIDCLFEVAGLSLRKVHLDRMKEAWEGRVPGELDLPGGWKLRKPTKKSWVLEKV